MKPLLCLLFAITLQATTVVNVACGSSSDTSFMGGARWTGLAISGKPAPYNAMRSSSPAGAPFSYTFQLQPGQYTVTLMFLEPRADQAAGQRLLNVAFNGTAVATGLDLFAQAGALKPFTASFPVTVTGALKIDFSATAGNSVVSGIQIDSVDVPQTHSKGQCEEGVGDGSGPMFTWPYVLLGCENMSGGPLYITRARCRSDVAGQVFDLLAPNAEGVMQSILVAPIICTMDGAEGPILPGASYADGQVLGFAIRIVDTPPQNASQVVASIVRESGLPASPAPPAPPVVLRECKGSGPGWDCAGMLWATLPMLDGSLVQLVGAPMPGFSPTAGTTWTERK